MRYKKKTAVDQQPGHGAAGADMLAVKSSDGRGRAITGTRVDGSSVHASEDLGEMLKQELGEVRSAIENMDLATFQALGHDNDNFKDIVRCPLCPFYWCTVATKDGKKKSGE